MFAIGDKVVHPTHGAGTVSGIEEKELLEQYNRYYIIELAATKMKLMIPVRTAEEIGLRPVAKPTEVEAIYQMLAETPHDMIDDFKSRQAALSEQLKSGDLVDIARVVRDLYWRNADTPLAPTESRQLETAKQQLASELSLAAGHEVETCLDNIDDVLDSALQNSNMTH